MRRFFPLLVIAFAVGALFKTANQYGIAAFRMFGTWGIVVIGIWGAKILRSLQVEDGLDQLAQEMQGLPSNVRVVQSPGVKGAPAWLLETERGKLLLGSSDVPHSAKGERARRSLAKEAVQLVNNAFKAGLIRDGDRVGTALVLLRKRVNDDERYVPIEGLPDPVLLVAPSEVGGVVRRLASAQ